MRQAPLIALLTDFGLADPYVCQMKAVLMAAAPGVPLVDVSHDVAPQDVLQAAFFLGATLSWLPPGTVVVAVVDPGVGTDRRVVLAEVGGRLVVAPDNGLLTLALGRGEACRLFDATPRSLPAAGTTFHGRDVFAPLAARLAMGEEASAVGTVWHGDAPVRLDGVAPVRRGETVSCRVLSIDRFGNVIVSLDAARFGRLPAAPAIMAPVQTPLVAVTTYAAIAPGSVGILAGSQGYLELASWCASAALRLGLSRGEAMTFFWPTGEGA